MKNNLTFLCAFVTIPLITFSQGDNNYTGTETTPCHEPAAAWYLGGNILAPQLNNGSNNYGQVANYTIFSDIGTCNNFDFVLKANNNLTMWIKPNTKVGISEVSPTAKFEVLETNPVSQESGGQYAKMLSSFRARVLNNFQHNDWVYRTSELKLGWEDYALHDGLSIDASYLLPGTDTRTWWERLPGQSIQKWGDFNYTYLTLNGNKLQVNEQNNALNTSVLNVNVHANNNVHAFEIYDESVQKITFNVESNGQTNVGQQNNALNSSMLNVNTNGGNAFEVFDASNQKINFKVKANGLVYAREINVMASHIVFPDYVFEKTYILKPINELESYIQVNKHLPNIPTAKDVAENGINLSDLQVKQMEKIEELYLYMIQQQKEIEELKEQNRKLERLINIH